MPDLNPTATPPTQIPQGILQPHRGAMILVFGIISIVMCSPLGPFAWIMGRSDLKLMDAGIKDPNGKGLTLAGMVLGIISTILLVLGFIIFLIYILIVVILGIGLAAGAASGGP